MKPSRFAVVLAATVAVACSSAENAAPAPADGGADAPVTDAGADAPEAPPDGTLPPHAKSLPWTYTRPEDGAPLTAQETSDVTDVYLDLLTKTHYFDFLDTRVHGWPESDPQGRYWYGTWWSGADVVKANGAITYHHNSGGADNNGIRTSDVLETACYASLLFGDASIEHLTRRLIRGFNSWILAMEQQQNDPNGVLLTRAAYPASFDDTDRGIHVDYDLNHPGDDNGATEYVHNPTNPFWGDIWVKNKRSKDDIGHMLRALSELDACDGKLTESGAQQDLLETRKHYIQWSRTVEDNGWAIASLDKSGNFWIPPSQLAHFTLLGNAECTEMLAIRLFGRFSPSDELACGNGIGGLDNAIMQASHSNGEILRSFHEAAVASALVTGNDDLALTLAKGLAQRVQDSLAGIEAGTPPPFMTNEDLAALMIHAATVGVPLTWHEVRFLDDRIREAHDSYLDPSNDPTFKTADASIPDGSYLFEPAGTGIDFKVLGALLGTCASQYKNPASKPVLDCDKIKAWTP